MSDAAPDIGEMGEKRHAAHCRQQHDIVPRYEGPAADSAPGMGKAAANDQECDDANENERQIEIHGKMR